MVENTEHRELQLNLKVLYQAGVSHGAIPAVLCGVAS